MMSMVRRALVSSRLKSMVTGPPRAWRSALVRPSRRIRQARRRVGDASVPRDRVVHANPSACCHSAKRTIGWPVPRNGNDHHREEAGLALDRRDRDLVELSVLALLLAGPKHTYEMHRMMIDTRKDFVTGLPRSMYHAVERLEKAGQIAPVETVRDGSKPERTVFAVTVAGREVVQDRIERLLAYPVADSSLFTAALSFLSCLPPERAIRALRTRQETLTKRAQQVETDLSRISGQLPRVLIIETEYELACSRAELAWVQALLEEVDAGALTWPADVAVLIDDNGGEEDHPN